MHATPAGQLYDLPTITKTPKTTDRAPTKIAVFGLYTSGICCLMLATAAAPSACPAPPFGQQNKAVMKAQGCRNGLRALACMLFGNLPYKHIGMSCRFLQTCDFE
jgi:hypothetical protein